MILRLVQSIIYQTCMWLLLPGIYHSNSSVWTFLFISGRVVIGWVAEWRAARITKNPNKHYTMIVILTLHSDKGVWWYRLETCNKATQIRSLFSEQLYASSIIISSCRSIRVFSYLLVSVSEWISYYARLRRRLECLSWCCARSH